MSNLEWFTCEDRQGGRYRLRLDEIVGFAMARWIDPGDWMVSIWLASSSHPINVVDDKAPAQALYAALTEALGLDEPQQAEVMHHGV